jgi:hypothetical protein
MCHYWPRRVYVENGAETVEDEPEQEPVVGVARVLLRGLVGQQGPSKELFQNNFSNLGVSLLVWKYGVVPLAVELVLPQAYCFQLLVRHLDTRLIHVGIQLGLDA